MIPAAVLDLPFGHRLRDLEHGAHGVVPGVPALGNLGRRPLQVLEARLRLREPAQGGEGHGARVGAEGDDAGEARRGRRLPEDLLPSPEPDEDVEGDGEERLEEVRDLPHDLVGLHLLVALGIEQRRRLLR